MSNKAHNQILEEKLRAVIDEKSFLNFILSLSENRSIETKIEKENPSSPFGAGALGWENGSIESFLDAAAEWGKASLNGLQDLPKSENIWRRCADILYAGKFYE